MNPTEYSQQLSPLPTPMPNTHLSPFPNTPCPSLSPSPSVGRSTLPNTPNLELLTLNSENTSPLIANGIPKIHFDFQYSAPSSPDQSPAGRSTQLRRAVAPSRRISKPKGSHAKKQPEGHIKRPKNAFILFRCHMVETGALNGVENDHRKISKIAGRIWNTLSKEQKAPYERQARDEKERHHQRYPDYRYSPMYNKSGSSSNATGTSSSSSAPRRRLKAPIDSHDEKRVKLIANLVSGGAAQDAVLRNVKDFDRGMIDVEVDDDSSVGNDDHDDEGSDFEDSLSKKAQRARARRATTKKSSISPPFPFVGTHELPLPSHPARRRSLSTPSLPTVPVIATAVRKARTHARNYSEMASAPTVVRISKGRTTNNSLAAGTPETGDTLFNNPIAPGHEQRVAHERRVAMYRETSVAIESCSPAHIASCLPPPLPYFTNPAPTSSQSTPAAVAASLEHHTPASGSSTFGSPFVNVGWSLDNNFLNPQVSPEPQDKLSPEEFGMYSTLGLVDDGPGSLMEAFGLDGNEFGMDTGELQPSSFFQEDYYMGTPQEGQTKRSDTGSPFNLSAMTASNAPVFNSTYSLGGVGTMAGQPSLSDSALDPIDPSTAPDFGFWINEDYFLSPSRGEELALPDPWSNDGKADVEMAAYRRGMSNAGTSIFFSTGA
ncbi:hypothetical protein FRB90_007913 [Tulasnella sp. 427]|nr:hypothetical protein FRB90_007913 [Tulasnella sp. 427]